MELQMRHFINAHKISTPFVVLLMMFVYDNYTIGPIIYLSLHGTYCVCWLLKDRFYPDRSFQVTISLLEFAWGYTKMFSYWVAPFILICYRIEPSRLTILLALILFTLGMFYHYGSDAQKFFTLQARKGLITNGFFAMTRNPNYLGEILIYSGFMLLSQNLVPLLILSAIYLLVFRPNMMRKDVSMMRHEGYKEYKARTNMLIPKWFC